MGESAIRDFLAYLQHQKRFSPLTGAAYSTDLTQFYRFLQDEIAISDFRMVQFRHVRSFMAGLMEAGMSAVTVNRKMSSLKSFYKFLLRTGSVTVNPCQNLQGPKKPKKLPVFIDQNKAGMAFSAGEEESDFVGRRDVLIMELLYQTGMRRAELLNLRVSDVDLYDLQIKVLGKRNKERVIPVSIDLKRNLENYINVKEKLGLQSEYLLVNEKGKPLNAAHVTAVVKRYLTPLTTSRKKSPHVLRHTFATHMLDNGADINAVKELLGHASLAATQVYTHNSIEKLKKLYKQAHPRSGH
jgi:integrase/recombinase XerC